MKCNCCPFECRVDRITQFGVCQAPAEFKVAKWMAHFWEEPCISGTRGSGAVFFSHCQASCLFCQNYKISHAHGGQKYQDEDFIALCKDFVLSSGVHNVNMVSPTHYSARLLRVLPRLKREIPVPIVWNSNGYEKESVIQELEGLIDIFLPDFKYVSDTLALRYSRLPHYVFHASRALKAMHNIGNKPAFNQEGIMLKGIIIRHLILPGQVEDSKKVLTWIAENIGTEVYISLMAQYYPVYRAGEIPELNRKITPEEYQEVQEHLLHLGFENGFLQELDSSSSQYTPAF
ncbi:MAG: 4Fe-4S cluster-binding domain-containing protein [bacterium]